MNSKKFVFICGLQRSCPCILFKILRDQPEISSFKNTTFPRDEGQFLQTDFPTDSLLGGEGIFGLNPDPHLDERSSLITQENK